MGENVQGIRSVIGRYKIDGEVRNSVGNRKPKNLMCMTHGHEQWWEDCLREWGMLRGEGKIRTTVIA